MRPLLPASVNRDYCTASQIVCLAAQAVTRSSRSMRWLDGDQLIGPVSLAVVMTIQAGFVIAVQESVLRIFG